MNITDLDIAIKKNEKRGPREDPWGISSQHLLGAGSVLETPGVKSSAVHVESMFVNLYPFP